MHDSEHHHRALQDSLLGARLAMDVARWLRPACLGMKERQFRAIVAAVVEFQMRTYAALPPA